MKYRAKCTHCIHLIENIYDLDTLEVWHGAHGTYVEVDTEEEAAEIEILDHYCGMTEIYYSRLIEVKNNKH